MGKSRNRAKAKDRGNPIGKAVKPPSDPELAALREKKILPIISDLRSSDTKKRSAAAVAIANIIEDTKCRKLLLREHVVKILLEQTITDSALESKSAGWGILRNLALEEDADFCVHLYRQDILTPIQNIIKTIIETIESQDHPITKLPKAQQELVWALSSSIVSLISSLAEAQDDILQAITNLPLISKFLFGLLSFEPVPGELFANVLTCLAVLTEDNENLAKQIVEHDGWLQGLLQLREHGGARAVTVCGVLHNIFSSLQWFDHNTPKERLSDAILVPTLMQCVEQCVEQLQGEDYRTNGSNQSSPDEVLQLALQITASIAASLQEALEHAGGYEEEFKGFENDDEEDLDDAMVEDKSEDGEDGQDSDPEADAGHEDGEMDEDEIDADMELVTGADHKEEEPSDEQPTLDTLVRAVPQLLPLANSSGPASISSESRSNALSTLNNIAWTLSSIDFDSPSNYKLRQAWFPLANEIWSQNISPILASNTADISLASSITSLAWAIARSVQGQVKLQADEYRKFMALYQASAGFSKKNGEPNPTTKPYDADEDGFQGLGVKCIGVLGRLALDPALVEINRDIGVFLLTTLAGLPETPPADAVEALNQIFDIYADKAFACDEVFWRNGFYKHLEDIAPKVKKMAKSIDKRKHTELRARADEAHMNLTRFLKYKKDEREL